MSTKIKKIKAREVLNSRGNPTVEVDLKTAKGLFRASVPSGASTGRYEAVELRDQEERYQGKGVKRAVANVNQVIGPELEGREINQSELDQKMIKLDGTDNKSKLGANAILPVSMAVCRAGAAAKGIPLYKHIARLLNPKSTESNIQNPTSNLPVPCFNIINGGKHAGNNLSIQEFMIVPQGEEEFKQKLRFGSEVYHSLKKILTNSFGAQATNVGDEGGFAPPLIRTDQALDLIVKAIQGNFDFKIALDCAASQFYKKDSYRLDQGVFTGEGLLKFYQSLIDREEFLFLEDPFEENDWENWKELMKRTSALIIGDDLLATNPERIKKAHNQQACNGMILKPNQIGTVSETLKAAKLAKSFDWKVIISHRSGETCDSFISDLAVGIDADFIKAGAPCRGERVAKYNRLLRIEEEL